MLNRMGLLGDQQDKLMKQQEDMDTRLREVGQDVLDVRYTADDIKNDVGKLRDEHTTNMQTMFRGLERANHVSVCVCVWHCPVCSGCCSSLCVLARNTA